ncbi:MAG: shikimate kinase [Wenzhouxiangella sp.]|jgi:shikimate kinase|nr:shikimate kinase [Wenzhouxiangella sp.]
MSLPRIFLIGPMGSGKTTVGRFLARRLGLEFRDLDQEIERRCGVEVSTIFDIEGEAGFRKREHVMLEELTRADSLLLATGGGSILRADNRALLRERGLVVWLRTRVDQQIRRLEKDQRRPLLQAPDREQRLLEMAETRDPLYAECAHLIVPSDNVSPMQMAQRAARQIQRHLESEQVS